MSMIGNAAPRPRPRLILPLGVSILLAALVPTVVGAADHAVQVAALSVYANTADDAKLPDGRTIHIVCMGSGSPTVILTAGLGDWSVIWSRVQRAIAARTRTCAWDRPGFGLSSPSALAQSVDHTTDELQAALRRSGINGPYVMVGHSLGGYETLLFSDRQPRDVVGMVLVEPSLPDQARRFARAAPAMAKFIDDAQQGALDFLKACADLARTGEIGPDKLDLGNCRELQPYYPPSVTAALVQAAADPRRHETARSMHEHADRSGELVVNPRRTYGRIPLVVLTAAGVPKLPPDTPKAVLDQLPAFTAEWSRGHAELAALSTRGVHRPVADADHYIQVGHSGAVIAAINEVLDAVDAPNR